MKPNGDRAFVVSVHDLSLNDHLHINLKWQGDHDISDFDLDRLGKVLNCETETVNSGWLIVEPYNRPNTYIVELQPPFGPPALEPSFLVGVGDTLPLKERCPAVLQRPTDFVCFWYCVMACLKERRLLTVAKCLGSAPGPS
jgi:hypothetical protein